MRNLLYCETCRAYYVPVFGCMCDHPCSTEKSTESNTMIQKLIEVQKDIRGLLSTLGCRCGQCLHCEMRTKYE